MPNIAIVLGSVRDGRMVERVGKLISRVVSAKGMTPVLLDPLETCKYEMVRQPLHFLGNPQEAPAWMDPTHGIIKNADGFVVLSSEYNCGIPPALSNLLSAFPPTSFRHKPCGIVTYSLGPFGGMRALTVLRPYLLELGLVITPTYGPIPMVDKLIDESGKSSEKLVTDKMDQLVREIQWYVEALKAFTAIKAYPN